jgi:hypothetical protein
MLARLRPGPTLALLSLPLLGACSGGGGGGSSNNGGNGSGGLAITGCSLSCQRSNSAGTQYSCSVTQIAVNEELRVFFNSPVNLSSVNASSFQVVERRSGKTPAGTFTLDPSSASTLVYRPLLTFDSSGNPTFGLTSGETYDFKIPGTALDNLGPYIRSVSGDDNATRMQCTLVASGVADPKPGPPRVTTTVAILDPQNPGQVLQNQPAQGQTNVYRFTDITMVFDDLMNPATLANPVTKESDFVTVKVDSDGNINTSGDQIEVDGEFTLTLDQTNLITTLVFKPTSGFPSAGARAPVKRKVVVAFSPLIADLGGNPLINPASIVFTNEVIAFSAQTITETFDNSVLEDSLRAGNAWGSGVLLPGPGGGSGRLGELVVPRGTTVTLNTDVEDFTAAEFADPTVFNPQLLIDPVLPLQVVGGVFEFSRLLVESGGILRLSGSNAGRLFVRGEILNQGLIDVAGRSAAVHTATEFEGGVGEEPGPAGGKGGNGGARPDGENFLVVGGVDNPNDPGPANPLDPGDYVLVNGEDGGGIPVPSSLNPTSFVAGGIGGLAWPQPGALPPPYDMLHFPADPDDALGTFPYEPFAACQLTAPGGAGSGGAHALDGTDAETSVIDVSGSPVPRVPEAQGGDSDDLGITSTARTLDPELGFLRGGGGGGGGGAHLLITSVNGQIGNDCTIPVGTPTLMIADYMAHSSAGGGGGGGAVQMQAGRRLVSNGNIIASGGDGGSSVFPDLAMCGGGGAGGAILLQGPMVQIQAVPLRLIVDGGLGGIGPFDSEGGIGGPGFLRLETFPPLLSSSIEKAKISPTEAQLQAAYGPSVSIDDLLSIGEWEPEEQPSGPSLLSGTQSCWFILPGNFFQLVFEPDGAELGWDMLLNLEGFATPQSYRGENDLTGPGGPSLEELWSNDLDTAPIVVRFQGARSIEPILQPCSVRLSGITSPLLGNSLTGWHKNPTDITTIGSPSGASANMFRFAVIWNGNDPNFSMIESVEDIRIEITPD